MTGLVGARRRDARALEEVSGIVEFWPICRFGIVIVEPGAMLNVALASCRC